MILWLNPFLNLFLLCLLTMLTSFISFLIGETLLLVLFHRKCGAFKFKNTFSSCYPCSDLLWKYWFPQCSAACWPLIGWTNIFHPTVENTWTARVNCDHFPICCHTLHWLLFASIRGLALVSCCQSWLQSSVSYGCNRFAWTSQPSQCSTPKRYVPIQQKAFHSSWYFVPWLLIQSQFEPIGLCLNHQ